MQPWERLEVFWVAEEYEAFIEHLLPRIREHSPNNFDQLERASGSISNNIAEGSSNRSRAERSKFFGYARRSAAESHIVLRRVHRRRVITEGELRISYYYSDRISATLFKLIGPGK